MISFYAIIAKVLLTLTIPKMLKIKLIFATIFVITFSFYANAESIQYIKDSVGIPIKATPEGKTIGFLANGDEVTILDKNKNYSQIVAPNGRTVWVETQFLQKEESLKHKVPALENQVQNLTLKLDNIEAEYVQEISDLKESVAQLTLENTQLKTKNEHLTQTNLDQTTQIEDLSNIADKNKQAIFMSWFTRGALVAGGFLIIGIILPFLFRRKKSSWN